MNNSELNDELICMYLDGEMPKDQRDAFEHRLAQDAGLQARLQRFRSSDQQLRDAFAVSDVSEFDPLVTRIKSTSFSSDGSAKTRSKFGVIALALAASMTGVMIGGIVWNSKTTVNESGVNILASDTLQNSLNQLQSGESRNGVEVVLSFRKNDKTPCRLFEVSHSKTIKSEGVSCRENGRWQLVAWFDKGSSEEAYRPASGGNSIIDEAIDRIDATGPLSLEQEKEFLLKK
jgi:hypothetical protein